MVHLRYTVLDPDRAGIVHDDSRAPRLLHEETGLGLMLPWMAHSSAQEWVLGENYNLLLRNPGGTVKTGDLITVTVGDSSLYHYRTD